METVKKGYLVNPRGLIGLMCIFGSGGRVTSKFSTVYKVGIFFFSFKHRHKQYCILLKIVYLQGL